jgi:cobalamin biosynthesis protein CobD/CbiB
MRKDRRCAPFQPFCPLDSFRFAQIVPSGRIPFFFLLLLFLKKRIVIKTDESLSPVPYLPHPVHITHDVCAVIQKAKRKWINNKNKRCGGSLSDLLFSSLRSVTFHPTSFLQRPEKISQGSAVTGFSFEIRLVLTHSHKCLAW